ncbi:hypothetical protein GCM10027443_32430 [Pontibacter brevis]
MEQMDMFAYIFKARQYQQPEIRKAKAEALQEQIGAAAKQPEHRLHVYLEGYDAADKGCVMCC